MIAGKIVCTLDGPLARDWDVGAEVCAEALEHILGAPTEVHGEWPGGHVPRRMLQDADMIKIMDREDWNLNVNGG